MFWLASEFFPVVLKEVKVNPTKSGRVAKKAKKKNAMEDQIYSAFFVVADNKSWKATYACDFTSLYILLHSGTLLTKSYGKS